MSGIQQVKLVSHELKSLLQRGVFDSPFYTLLGHVKAQSEQLELYQDIQMPELFSAMKSVHTAWELRAERGKEKEILKHIIQANKLFDSIPHVIRAKADEKVFAQHQRGPRTKATIAKKLYPTLISPILDKLKTILAKPYKSFASAELTGILNELVDAKRVMEEYKKICQYIDTACAAITQAANSYNHNVIVSNALARACVALENIKDLIENSDAARANNPKMSLGEKQIAVNMLQSPNNGIEPTYQQYLWNGVPQQLDTLMNRGVALYDYLSNFDCQPLLKCCEEMLNCLAECAEYCQEPDCQKLGWKYEPLSTAYTRAWGKSKDICKMIAENAL
jgi:hypothetical protein